MIRYKLICKGCFISFDSWFSSSADYEKLKEKKILSCHICNSLDIEKTLMSPSISRSRNSLKFENKNNKYKEIKKKLSKYQDFVKKNFEYVGDNFAYEARSMHYKNKITSKGIYGTATKKDISDLKEEGIETEMIPWIKNSDS